jgi:hypothetical protein
LNQTNSLAYDVDLGSIASSLHLDRNSVPLRNATFDWAYADIREILAVSQFLSSSLQTYCWNRVGGLYNARLEDDACADSVWPFPQGFPNYFTSFESSLEILASYGISGDITVPTTTVSGLEVQTSLITGQISSSSQPAVSYCSPVPLPINGVPTGELLSQFIVDIGAKCSGSRRDSGFIAEIGKIRTAHNNGALSQVRILVNVMKYNIFLNNSQSHASYQSGMLRWNIL